MNIVVVGLGSMGRRRIRLLQMLGDEYHIAGVDGRSDRCQAAQEEYSIKTFDSLDDALDDCSPECVVVSTSPLSHAGIIERCLKHGCNVFTELNLVSDGYADNMRLAGDNNKILFLSSTLLYRSEIRYIRDRIDSTKGMLNYVYHVGQYLPDWHPWESIGDYFVGDSRTNGCRELFAIELPWLLKTFGEIESYEVLSGRNTGLTIQYDDNYLLLIKHANGNKGILGVDVMSRKAVRNLEVFGEDLYITWDGTPRGLKEYDPVSKAENTVELYDHVDKQEGYASFVIENAYRSELETFIGMVNGSGKPEYTFEDDIKVLALIDEIEGIRN